MITKNYNFITKLIHYLILNNKISNQILFYLEKVFFLKKDYTHNFKRPALVTGLARSGTTILLNALYESGEFASNTYNDMPFIICPNIWGFLNKFNNKSKDSYERAHKDGIKIGINSPEAFEEIFWNSFVEQNYVKERYLDKHQINTNIDKNYNIFQFLVCLRYGKKRYLSKNNNNILRLQSLQKSITKPFILIPYRDPISHAISLMNQHKNFSNSDQFVKKYFSWLNHYEFGDNHKPFNFDLNSDNEFSKDTLNYWLKIWIDYHDYLLNIYKKNNKNIFLINYEKLCKNENYWINICKKINIIKINKFDFKYKENNLNNELSKKLLKKSECLKKNLDRISFLH